MSQTIAVSIGAVEYTWPVTIVETTGQDISGAVVKLSLGTDTAPSTWLTPDVDQAQDNAAVRVVQLLIDNTIDPGSYGLWVKVSDTVEIVPRKVATLIVA